MLMEVIFINQCLVCYMLCSVIASQVGENISVKINNYSNYSTTAPAQFG